MARIQPAAAVTKEAEKVFREIEGAFGMVPNLMKHHFGGGGGHDGKYAMLENSVAIIYAEPDHVLFTRREPGYA